MSGISQEQLASLSRQAGVEQRHVGDTAQGDGQVLEGDFVLKRHHSGILVHASDAVERQDTQVSFELPAGLSATLLLEGELAFRVDQTHYHLEASSLSGFALVCDQPRELQRELRQGRRLRKVNVSVPKAWLYQYCGDDEHACRCIDQLFATHQASCFSEWAVSSDLTALAEQIFRPSPYTSFMQNLHVESRALEILDAALAQLLKDTQAPSGPRKVERARDFIEAELQTLDSLEQVASHVGMSESSLQRQFRQHYQLTPAAYIRQRRLERARDLLRQQQLSIGEAAYLAGYRHPSNFITAYKRAFGTTPGEL